MAEWYNPENVRLALIGRDGVAQVESEIETYEELEGPGRYYFVKLKNITTEPPPGFTPFSGNAIALVRKTRDGKWTVSGRFAPDVECDVLSLPETVVRDVWAPWGDHIIVARDFNLDTRGKPTADRSGNRPGKTAWSPPGAGSWVFLTRDMSDYPEWCVAQFVGLGDTDGELRFRTRSGIVSVAADSHGIGIPPDKDGYQEAMAAYFAHPDRPEWATLRALKTVIGTTLYHGLKRANDNLPPQQGGIERYAPKAVDEIVLVRHQDDADRPKSEQRWMLSKSWEMANGVIEIGGARGYTDFPSYEATKVEWDPDRVFIEQIPQSLQVAALRIYKKMLKHPHDERAKPHGKWKSQISASKNSEAWQRWQKKGA